MSARVFVARDAGALAVGADEVARALARSAERRNTPIDITRTGSRGLYWLEPMVEVATTAGRVAYGPVTADDVEELLDPVFSRWRRVPDSPRTDRRDSLAEVPDPADLRALRHRRSAFARRLSCPRWLQRPRTRPLARARRDHRGDSAIGPAWPRRRRFPDRDQVAHGGAGPGPQKYIVCNADEGDFRDLRRPHADRGRSVRPDRRYDDCRDRGRRHHGLRLRPV